MTPSAQLLITNSLLNHLPIHNPPLSLLTDQVVANPQVFIARRNELRTIEHFGFFRDLRFYLGAIGISRIRLNSTNFQLVYITLVRVVSLLSFCHQLPARQSRFCENLL